MKFTLPFLTLTALLLMSLAALHSAEPPKQPVATTADFGANSWEHAPSSYQVPAGMVFGGAFIDRSLPMPVDHGLTTNVWGGDNVKPRNADNGLEDPPWSYCLSVGGHWLNDDDFRQSKGNLNNVNRNKPDQEKEFRNGESIARLLPLDGRALPLLRHSFRPCSRGGTGHLTRTLALPPGTRVRGMGQVCTVLAPLDDAPLKQEFLAELLQCDSREYLQALRGKASLLLMGTQCGIERLTVRGGPEMLCVLVSARGEVARDVGIKDCEIVNKHATWFPRMEFRSPVNGVLLAGATHGLRITGCRLECHYPLSSLMSEMRRATIADNILTSFPPGRSDSSTLRKPVECLIENNTFMRAKRGLVIQPQGMAVHNVVANNLNEHTERDDNAGEIELWEGGTSIIVARVTHAGPDSVTTDTDLAKAGSEGTKKKLVPADMPGKLCLITEGRGLGQYRFIAKAGDPEDPRWTPQNSPARMNIVERNYVDYGWPVGIYESRSTQGNIIPDTNKLLSERGVIRRP